jgi:tetratricopeptide (TPR) repeat protein
MKLDSRGLEVTTDSNDAIAAIDRYTNAALSLTAGMDEIVALADTMAECAMLQACAASLYVYSQSSTQARGALPYLARAGQRMGDLTERERIFIAGLEAGCAGDFERALAYHEQIAERWPRDLLAAKVAEFHFFETGECERQLRFMEKIAPANSDSSHAQAMYAFALELNGQRERAEQVARDALRMDPLAMWAQHCLAHVYGGQSRVADGIAAMEGWAPGWARFGQYIQSHNWFHLATFYRARLDFDRVMAAYRGHIWGFQPDMVVEHTDAILMLWYVELAGGDCGPAWREIAPHICAKAHEQVFPFLTTIYLYALERAGESAEVDRALDEMARHAERQTGWYARVWKEIGLAEARGSVAFARGDYDRAAELLGPALADIAIGGGSDEQRGVFSESHFMSLIRAGRKEEAERALQAYTQGRAAAPLHRWWLAQAGQ